MFKKYKKINRKTKWPFYFILFFTISPKQCIMGLCEHWRFPFRLQHKKIKVHFSWSLWAWGATEVKVQIRSDQIFNAGKWGKIAWYYKGYRSISNSQLPPLMRLSARNSEAGVLKESDSKLCLLMQSEGSCSISRVSPCPASPRFPPLRSPPRRCSPWKTQTNMKSVHGSRKTSSRWGTLRNASCFLEMLYGGTLFLAPVSGQGNSMVVCQTYEPSASPSLKIHLKCWPW